MERLTVRVTPEIEQAVSKLAEEKFISQASAVRLMLQRHLGLPEIALVEPPKDTWNSIVQPLVVGFECLTARDFATLMDRCAALKTRGSRRTKLKETLGKLGFRRVKVMEGKRPHQCFVKQGVDPTRALAERLTTMVPSKRAPIPGRSGPGRPGSFQDHEVIEMRRLFTAREMTIAQIARKFNCSPANISSIVRGNTYRHVAMPVPNEHRIAQEERIQDFLTSLGVNAQQRKLGDACSDTDILHIQEMFLLGISQVSLAYHYATSQQTIGRFISGERRADPMSLIEGSAV